MFKWAYWNLLLKGKELPMGPEMTLKGKIIDEKPVNGNNVNGANKKDNFISDKQQLQKLSGGR
jgi:hypothetical protein